MVRGTVLKHLRKLTGALFENVDDALFGLAEKAESNSAQTGHFDGMREVRKKRDLVARVFQERFGEAFSDFAAGRIQRNPISLMPKASS